MATSVIAGTYTETAVQIARDCLSGYDGAYLFCEIAPFSGFESSYQLILCDEIDYTGNMDVLTLYADTFHIITISFDVDDEVHYTYFSAQMQAWEFARNGAVVYSSLEYMPHLIDGGAYYGYMQSGLIICICIFVLFDRVLRHVR